MVAYGQSDLVVGSDRGPTLTTARCGQVRHSDDLNIWQTQLHDRYILTLMAMVSLMVAVVAGAKWTGSVRISHCGCFFHSVDKGCY
jgi:hypothetical protein